MPNPFRTRILKSPVDSLHRFRAQLPAGGDPRPVFNLAGAARSHIIARTSRGEGPGGRPFPSYKPGIYYAPIAKRPVGYPKPSGGRRKTLKTGRAMKTVAYAEGYAGYKAGIGRGKTPQLSVSGKMLGAIQIAQISATEAHLFFAGREEAAKAHGHEFGTTVPKRVFFDLSDIESETELRRLLVKNIRDMARRAKLELEGRL